MKKNVIIVLVTAMFVFLILSMIGSSKKDEKSTVTSTENVSKTFKDTFMNSCVSDGLYAYCSCAYDTLENKLGLTGIANLSIKYDETGELPNGTIEMISPCFELID